LPTIALELFNAYQDEFERLLAAIAADAQDGVYRAVLFAHIRSYDETPEKAAITQVTDGVEVETEAKVGKLMAGFRDFVILLQRSGSQAGPGPSLQAGLGPSSPGDTEACTGPSLHAGLVSNQGFLQIRGTYPALLLPIATHDAAVVWETIKRLRSFKMGVDQVINDTFDRVVHMTLADSHPSNIKAERADEHVLSQGGVVSTSFRCRVHRLDTCEKRLVELLPEVEAGMMAVTLFL